MLVCSPLIVGFMNYGSNLLTQTLCVKPEVLSSSHLQPYSLIWLTVQILTDFKHSRG